MSKVSEKLKEEFLAMIPPTIFFFVALHIVALIRMLMLKATGLSPLSTISIAVAALILGKSVLLADMLPLVNRFPERPLIYNVAWKTLIYLLMSALIHYLERLYDFSREAGALSPETKNCWRRSSGRISGRSRSFCSCLSSCIARCTN